MVALMLLVSNLCFWVVLVDFLNVVLVSYV